MIYIVGNLMFLGLVLGFIFYRVFVEKLLPAILRSKHAKLFKQRISNLIRRFFFDMRDDFVAHLVTLLEPDGDDPFQPYLDSPLRTCPPCEFVASPAKEGVLEESNNNWAFRTAPPPPHNPVRRGGRGRARAAPRRVQAPPAIRLPQILQPVGVGRGGGGGPPLSPPPARNLFQDIHELIAADEMEDEP